MLGNIKSKKRKIISIEANLKIKKENFSELNEYVFETVNNVLDFPEKLKQLTWKEKTMAIVSDGSSFFNLVYSDKAESLKSQLIDKFPKFRVEIFDFNNNGVVIK